MRRRRHDPPAAGGGFAFGAAAVPIAGTGGAAGFVGRVWAWSVAAVIARWRCLVTRCFSISGGRMAALHSDIRGGERLL